MSVEQTIPVVDLRDYTEGDAPTRDAFVQKFGDALKEFGFVAVEGHGVSRDLIYGAYGAFQDFFALEDDVKRQYENAAGGRKRGYTSFGVEHAKDNAKPDLKEFFHLGREDRAEGVTANLWPQAEAPQVKAAGSDLFEAMDACAQTMLEAVSIYLGCEPDFLPEMARGGDSIVRVIHYPVCDGFDEPGKMRAAQHEDINLMTLLPESTESGLELLTREGEWLPIHAIEGQMIVDTGDMMQRITNGLLPATTHRVVNPAGEPTPRYSMSFFVHPRPEVMLEVLDVCLAEGEEPRTEPVTAEEYLNERLRANGVK